MTLKNSVIIYMDNVYEPQRLPLLDSVIFRLPSLLVSSPFSTNMIATEKYHNYQLRHYIRDCLLLNKHIMRLEL